MSEVRAAENQSAIAGSLKAGRIPAFDFTKGALVLFMVLYHWLNYFIGATGDVYKYLRFLTPSFIFITGFLISYVHFSKYGADNPLLSKRLFVRGLKLIGLFVLLNACICLLLPNSPVVRVLRGNTWLDDMQNVFISGNTVSDGISKTASFIILVPIGYLLMISALLLVVGRRYRYAFHVACGLSLLVSIFSPFGIQSVNLNMLAIGLLGVVFGYVSPNEIARFARHPYVIGFAYCVYLIAVTVWDVPFPLRIIGVILTTALIYIAGNAQGEPGILRKHVILLGSYSLFGYISQIAFLQMLRRGLSHVDLSVGVMGISLIAGFALTMLGVEIVDWARKKSPVVNKVYRVVFA